MYFTYVWTNAIGKYSCLVWLGFMVGERWPINLSFLLFSSLFHVLCCIGPSIACCLQLWLMLVNGHGRPVGDPRPERVRVWASKWTRGGHGFFSGSDSSVAGTGLGGQNPMGLCPLPTHASGVRNIQNLRCAKDKRQNIVMNLAELWSNSTGDPAYFDSSSLVSYK